MKTRTVILIFLVCCLIAGCSSAGKREQTITISGAFALYPLTVKWAEEYRKEHPEVRFNITGGGAGKGMADALAGTVDLGMFSRAISQAELDQGVWWAGVAIDAVLPVINSSNPVSSVILERGVTPEEFSSLFLSGNPGFWEQFSDSDPATPITVYTRADACGAAETWAKFLGGSQEELKGVGIYGDPGLADAIAKDPHGIGYNNAIYIYDIKTGALQPGLTVPPIDLNRNGKVDPEEDFYGSHTQVLEAIATGIYPSPPARDLYFVSRGKPVKPVVNEFIRWTLTTGQQFIQEAGYVPLDSLKLVAEREKLQ